MSGPSNITVFFDAEGNPVDADDPRAVGAEVTEFDGDGNVVNRIYADVGPKTK